MKVNEKNVIDLNIYSLDLIIHYCNEEDLPCSHDGNTICLGRHSGEECKYINKIIGGKLTKGKRPAKPNYREQKYGKETKMIDTYFIDIYVGKDGQY